ncbi:MAG: hypothetical protein HYU71_10425 [Bacteroidetes bacterium]|nr:hypothetical protein [Bacteroidota bacterium]
MDANFSLPGMDLALRPPSTLPVYKPVIGALLPVFTHHLFASMDKIPLAIPAYFHGNRGIH